MMSITMDVKIQNNGGNTYGLMLIRKEGTNLEGRGIKDMILGEIIQQYADEHSVADFIRDSGLSKSYTYQLINNKNTCGEPVVPTIETIKKVAKGVHASFDDVFNKLDYDFVVRVEGKKLPPSSSIIPQPKNRQLRKLLNIAKASDPEDVQTAIDLLKKLNEIRK